MKKMILGLMFLLALCPAGFCGYSTGNTVAATQSGTWTVVISTPVVDIGQDYETKVSTYIAGSITNGGTVTATGMNVDFFQFVTTGTVTVNWGGGNEMYCSSAAPLKIEKLSRTISAPVFTVTDTSSYTVYYLIQGVK